MRLFIYIWKGLNFLIINPISLILKYIIKGVLAPILLLKDLNERKSIKQGSINSNKKKNVIKVKTEKERAEIREKERQEMKKQQEKLAKQTALKKRLEEKREKKRLKREKIEEAKKEKARLKEEQKQKAHEERLKKLAEKNKIEEEKALKKIQEEERKKQEKEEALEKKRLERQKRLEEKKRIKEEKKARRQHGETKEEKALRKAKEKQEKEEKERIARQKKIEALHEKQQRRENAIYRKEKEKQEERRRKEELKKKKKEEKERIRAEKKKKENDSYVNDKVTIEKPGMKGKFAEFKAKLKALPDKIVKKISNNSFSKSARNRRDMNRQALLIDFEGDEAQRSDVKLIYEYEAKSPEGKYVKGHFEAFSKVEVHSFLLSEGYEVYKIQTNKWIQFKYSSSASNKRKFKTKDLIFFLTQLSTYLKAGITLSEALKILARQFSSTKAYENIFKSINYELSVGESFSDALAKQGEAFPRLLINMLKTAEMTGSLPEVLDDMAEYYNEMEESRRQLVTAMMYPSIVAIFAVAVMTFIMVYVVPQFVEIYDSMEGTEIPKFTLVVMDISAFLKENLVWILVGAIIAILTIYFLYKKSKIVRTLMQIGFMKIPVIGNTVIYNEVTTFTKTLGSLLSHNVPIIECMDILNKITNNEVYKMLILDVITNLARGGKISESFSGHWAFPVPAYEMIVTGEKTGELAEMMQKVSIYYQDLQKNTTARIKTIIEPALTVFLALGTGIIVLAIVIPMFNMYSAVSEMG